jgi:hypothetical protein
MHANDGMLHALNTGNGILEVWRLFRPNVLDFRRRLGTKINYETTYGFTNDATSTPKYLLDGRLIAEMF